MRLTPLTNVPGALGSLLSGVGARVRYEFAQSSRAAALSYPSAFIVDTAPPVVSGLGAAPINAGQSAAITWTTNEFATSAVFYGAQSGNLNQSVSSALYNKTHSLTLAGLTPNSTYYYKVRNVDLKGNVTESAQNSFVATQTRYLYLPLVRR
jgi:predicted phage tail protein